MPSSQVDLTTGIDLKFIPAGCFEMGSSDVGTVGEVCIDAFYLSRHEVTNGQFRRFRSTHDSGSYMGQSLNGESQPVVNVSWHDAVAFTAWLSELADKRFRLATEAEWEYACRAGRSEVPLEELDTQGNLRIDPTSTDDTSKAATVAVGSFATSPFDLHDMHGNASEWVLDTYVEGADRFGNRHVNPFVEIENNALRVRRGGSWSSSAAQTQCAARDYYVGDLVVPHTGFRIVQELSSQ